MKIEIKSDKHFQQALSVIDATDEERNGMTESSTEIVQKIVDNYEQEIGTGYVGSTGKGLVDTAAKKATPVGLLYGRIQSGKTRAMILSGAMALDNRFRVVVILTSDINRLVDQTHQDFIDGLPTVQIYSKSDIKGNSLDTEAAHIARSLEEESYGVVVVGSKGATVLKQLTEFLTKIGAEKYPTLIFDDEGDQATLDTNVSKRSTKDPSLQASTIHSLVHSKENDSLRQAMPYAAFVSVTGTPQGIFLQNAESSSKLSFVHLLEAGEKYVGGKVFFGEPTPTNISYIRTIDEDENIKLLEPETEVPDGLQDAICFFVVSATSAGITRGKWDDFKMLCHPSVKQSDHDSVMRLIDKYVGQIIVALRDTTSTEAAPILKKMEAAYSDLSKTCTGLPSLDDILKQAKTSILQRKLFVVNAKSTNDDMRYSKQYNFIVGGNTVGRGLAIKNLLVTYYTRMPKSTRADTMYQHARMFGYRGDTLPYTRVFLPPQLYDRFHQIYLSDEEARDYIQKNGFDDRGALLLRTAQPGFGLKPTRPNILDANRVKVIYPGHAIYPNYPKYKKGEVEPINTKVDQLIGKIAPNLVSNGSQEISVTDAEKIAKAIKTNATNTWADKQVANYLKSFAHQLKKDKVLLRYRTSKRQPGGSEGYLSQGILNVEELKAGRENAIPTIILAKIAGKGWDGVDFYYPTIISPDTLSPFIFNKN